MSEAAEILAPQPARAETAPFLTIEGLTVTRGGAARPLLDNFSLTLLPGETVVLLGESGCGKEVLMRVLGGLCERGEQVSGTLAFAGAASQRAGRKIHRGPRTVYLPGPRAHPLSPNASVLSQLVRVLARRLGTPRASARAELEIALGRMAAAPDISELDDLPHRLAPEAIAWGLFAMAFAQTPEFVIADHPLAAIAPLKLRALAHALKAEQKRLGFTLLYAAMGTEVAGILNGRTLVLRNGRIVEEGPLSRLTSPQAHAYTRTLFRDRAVGDAPRNAGRGEPVLQISGLELARTAPTAPRETLNFELRRGAALALVGEEGSGRRALLRQIIGLDRVRNGRIVFDSVDLGILSTPMQTRLRRRIAYITGDDDALDPRMTISDTVGEPLRAHLGLPREVVAGYREAALKRVGLASLPGNRAVATLSPFDKRRLQIARAIVTAPLLAIFDEPLSGLDAFAQSVMRDLLGTFRSEEGPAVLLVTADFSVARALAETAFVFSGGKIVERGAVPGLMQAPKDIATRTLIDAVVSPASAGLS
jgi:ABC-type glutathione transport system ATPase component